MTYKLVLLGVLSLSVIVDLWWYYHQVKKDRDF